MKNMWQTRVKINPTDGAEILPQQNIFTLIWLESCWGAFLKYLLCKTQVGLFIDFECQPSNPVLLTENYILQQIRNVIFVDINYTLLTFISCWGIFNLIKMDSLNIHIKLLLYCGCDLMLKHVRLSWEKWPNTYRTSHKLKLSESDEEDKGQNYANK